MAAAIRAAAAAILAANADDVAAAKAAGQTPAFLDRLALDEARLEAVAAAVEGVAELPDPVGRVLATFERPNGLTIERVATPLGVIGVIFESRPNVDGRCRRALPQGRERRDPARRLRQLPLGGGDRRRHASRVSPRAGLPAHAIQLVPTRDRAAVGAMLAGLDGNLDVIVPRGGKSLVARVQAEARVPVFAHLEGVVPRLCPCATPSSRWRSASC